MASTLSLDAANWDLLVDSAGNMAVLAVPAALAQDAASAIKTFLGECYWDVGLGVPYMTQILGKKPSLALLKQQLVNAALTVSGVASAQCFITSFSARGVVGQVQVVGTAGQTSAANFAVINPQGVG